MQSADSPEVLEHLESCDDCRALHQDLLSLKQLSGELKGQMDLPPFFTERVCSQTTPTTRPVYWKFAAALAGLVFLAIGIVNFVSVSSETDASAAASAPVGKERIYRIDASDLAVTASGIQRQGQVFSLDGKEWEEITPGDHLTFQPDVRIAGVDHKTSPPSYVFELPATIEVRQTQAENEFYLQNVSH